MTQPKTRGLMLTVPADLHRKLRFMAAEQDTTIAALVRQAIENLMLEQPDQAGEKEVAV